MPRLGVKTTWRVDSHFSPPAIHTGPTAYPQRRQRLTLLRAGRSAPHGRHRPGRERPPKPRAWYGLGTECVFTTRPPPSRGRSRSMDPLAGRPLSAAGSAADQRIALPSGSRLVGQVRGPGEVRDAPSLGHRPWPASGQARPAIRGRRRYGVAISHHDALRWSADLRGVRGGTAPRQPLPGTREAWPQRVSWLKHVSPRLRCRHSGRERTRPGVVGARSLWRFRSAGSIADPARLGVVPTPGTPRIRDPQAPASPHVGLDQSTDCAAPTPQPGTSL